MKGRESVLTTAILGLWTALLVLTGTYLRIRADDVPPSLDWVVSMQLLTAVLAGGMGALLVWSNRRLGMGSAVLLLFALVALASAANTPFPAIVIGYWIVLWGVVLMILGIQQELGLVLTVEAVERLWLWVATAIVLKDSALSIAFAWPFHSPATLNSFRLGMGTTHATAVSLLACIGFVLTFDRRKGGATVLLLRSLFVAVVLLSRSRISLICLVITTFLIVVTKYEKRASAFGRPHMLQRGLCVALLIVPAWGSFYCLKDVASHSAIVTYLSRGQDAEELSTLTGRTDIWTVAVSKAWEDIGGVAIGHGYGVSRLVLSSELSHLGYEPSHLHNALLEMAFSMGVPGIIVYVGMILAGLRWVIARKRLISLFGDELVMRATCVLIIVVASSFTESFLALKPGPVVMMFFVYLVVPDGGNHLGTISAEPNHKLLRTTPS